MWIILVVHVFFVIASPAFGDSRVMNIKVIFPVVFIVVRHGLLHWGESIMTEYLKTKCLCDPSEIN
jgi:hypothetical protein